MDFRVMRSDDGRMIVQSKYDDFVASFKHGEWVQEMMFDSSELGELSPVDDQTEALSIVKEAKKALHCL